MPMTRPETELKVPKDQFTERLFHHVENGSFKIEMVKNADNITWDMTAWYVVDQRKEGFNK